MTREGKKMNNTGKLLRDARLSEGYTQAQLGKKLGFASAGQFISNIENGRAPLPSKHIKKIAKILKIRAEDIKSMMIGDFEDSL